MADEFCFSLLHTTTLQLLQSAGFESGHVTSTQVLTNIFQRYIEQLSTTVAAYSNLAGRSTGNIHDVVDAFEELDIRIPDLKTWLSEEAKSLYPTWTDQGDPSRTLKGIIYNGLNRQETELYEFQEQPKTISDIPLDPIDEPETDQNPTQLPAYVPSHLPEFPITQPEDESNLEPILTLPVTKPTATAEKIATDSLPLPNIVKKKTRPIDNPFTHLKPFEDSILASHDQDQPEPLSLSLPNTQPSEPTHRPRPSEAHLMQIMHHVKSQEDHHDLIRDHQFFVDATQSEATPGNTMFSAEQGLLDKLMTDLAPAIAVPKLRTPNLMMDIVATPTGSASMLRLSMNSAPRRTSVGGFTIDETPAEAPVEDTSTKIKINPISLASFANDDKTKKKLTISLPKPQDEFDLALPVKEPVEEDPKPKIRFKIKLPTAEPLEDYKSDEIHCVCDNPTVDYGTFMIACDLCGVWFHGLCVGIAETDQIEEWQCVRCIKRKKAKKVHHH